MPSDVFITERNDITIEAWVKTIEIKCCLSTGCSSGRFIVIFNSKCVFWSFSNFQIVNGKSIVHFRVHPAKDYRDVTNQN